MNVGVILSGGTGTRFGANVPKQYLKINGKEVLAYAINALKKSKADEIIVVCHDDYAERIRCEYGVKTVPNGDTRNASLKNALRFIEERGDCEKVIILEAARPMVKAEIIDFYFEKLDSYDAVITGQRIVDSLGCFYAHSVNRKDYYLIQAPEAFNFGILNANFDENSPLTATNQQMPEGSTLYINFDFTNNYKITYPQDLAYCEAMMNEDE